MLRSRIGRLRIRYYRLLVLFVILPIAFLLNCASVPKEIVELSYRTGQDIRSVQESYKMLIRQFYDQLRSNRLDYIEQEWAPLFIKIWLEEGRLIDVAKGEVVWSEEEADFVLPTAERKEQQLLSTVLTWAEEAIYTLEDKKSELLNPLNRQEDSLLVAVSAAMNQIIQANAAITAHLNSLREVQEIQDEALSALGIKDLRDKINITLSNASERAKSGLEDIRKADRIASKIEKGIEKITTELEGEK